MKADWNKSIKPVNSVQPITYSYLNKPEQIALDGKGNITYLYDALGNKLRKTVVDQTQSPTTTTVTDYDGPFVYETSTNATTNLTTTVVKYIMHEEGRCRPIPAGSTTPT